MYHAYFSEQAANAYGSSYYEGEGGTPVEVTGVAEDFNWFEKYLWTDKVYVGKVGKYIGQARKGKYYDDDFFWSNIREHCAKQEPGFRE